MCSSRIILFYIIIFPVVIIIYETLPTRSEPSFFKRKLKFFSLSINRYAWDPTFLKSATVPFVFATPLLPLLHQTLALQHSRPTLFRSVINLIHFIFYDSIREEEEREKKTRSRPSLYGRAVFPHRTLCLALISTRRRES